MAETTHTEPEHRDYIGAKLGMWLFLFTEILLFGGMFLVYAVYRTVHTADFHEAAKEMEVTIGAINTMILITSSMTMTLSIWAIKKGDKARSLLFQAITVVLGLVFLVNKGYEWREHILHGYYPDSPKLLAMSHGKILYFGLYFVMTGIHGIHVLIGAGIIVWMIVLTARETVTATDYVKLENAGLFWSLVDIVWIFLFPLFYLIA